MSCNHDCNNCSEKCEQKSLREPAHQMSSIKRVIGVVSGKGGVGKSMVTGLLATMLKKRGYKTGVLDADITGPSIPKMFGIHSKAQGTEEGLFPNNSQSGIKIMSSNLLLKEETDPVVWRGPIIAGLVKQFWTDVIWQDIDYLFVDMPPGTGDVPLTVFQSIGVDGIIIVLSPQELVGMIVEKAVNMAKMMNIEVLGLVENMSYIECPDCHKKINVFGESQVHDIARKYNLDVLAQIPIDPTLTKLCDKGEIEKTNVNYINEMCDKLEQLPVKTNKVAVSYTNDSEYDVCDYATLNGIYIYELNYNMIISRKKVVVEDKESLLEVLLDNNVTTLLCSQIKEITASSFKDNGINVLSDNQGNANEVIKGYIKNTLN